MGKIMKILGAKKSRLHREHLNAGPCAGVEIKGPVFAIADIAIMYVWREGAIKGGWLNVPIADPRLLSTFMVARRDVSNTSADPRRSYRSAHG